MNTEYQIYTITKYNTLISALLDEAPPYLTDYRDYMQHEKQKKPSSMYIYLCSILAFIRYEHDVIPECDDIELRDMPIFVFDKLTEEDLQRYHAFLKDVRMLKKTSIHENMVAISAYYRYLNRKGITRNNPFLFYDRVKPQTVRPTLRIDGKAERTLLQGITDNRLYLAQTENGPAVLPIPEDVRIRRELNVLRNHAICTLLLHTDISVSDLVGLNVSDIDLDNGKITVPGNSPAGYTHIHPNRTCIEALSRYLYGETVDEILMERFFVSRHDVWDWAFTNIRRIHPKQSLYKSFPDETGTFYEEALRLLEQLRRHGRVSYKPKPSEKALFLSNRGTRITIRMIQYMVKEAVKTYIPEYDDTELFTPHTLRNRE